MREAQGVWFFPACFILARSIQFRSSVSVHWKANLQQVKNQSIKEQIGIIQKALESPQNTFKESFHL